ncbi:MAG: pantoate--beta-alanine ligase [Lentisphaeria bacterium]|nr:pantoate--beta-alanine ligase [Lentisphaeria bacterium]NQZ67786.1 pantoate--beta-alanine ligase [Lentisphaeria bacterium]
MIVIESVAGMQAQSRNWQQSGESIALVATMGNLHQGHISLVDIAKNKADRVVVSIFVNPTQFAEGEDLDTYPKTWDADKTACELAGVDCIFFPGESEMYYKNKSIGVSEESLSQSLCGASRPGHFSGVVTVVAKLFNICLPDYAVFGRKDFQQLSIIKRLVRDLNFPIEILEGDIIREADGLAMSSRNQYLSADERLAALLINQSLHAAELLYESGEKQCSALIRRFLETAEQVGLRIDYAEIRSVEHLELLEMVFEQSVFAVAVYVGDTRLIDNVVLKSTEI